MATAKVTDAADPVLECPVCVARITKPTRLQCQHYFCKSCIGDLKEVQEASNLGHNCPICEKFTSKLDMKEMELVQVFFTEIGQISKKSESIQCVSCKDATPTCRCLDCKDNFCDTCKCSHDAIPILKSHKWEAYDEAKDKIIDRVVFCKIHPEKLMELYCKDCKELLCVLCNGTDHKTHQSETVADALERIVPSIKTRQEEVKTSFETNKRSHERMISDAEDIKKKYEEMDAEVDKEYEKRLNKLKEDQKSLKKQLSESRTKQTSVIGQEVKLLERKIRMQKNTLELSKTVLTCTEGASRLQFLTDVVIENLDSCVREKSTLKQFSKSPDVIFEGANLVTGNIIGIVKNSSSSISMQIPKGLSELAVANFVLDKEVAKSFSCRRIAKIANELWCNEDESNRIHRFSQEGQTLGRLQITGGGYCRSVVETPLGVLHATSSGLFLTTKPGLNQRKCFPWNLCDISVRNNKVYALQNQEPKVHILSYDVQESIVSKQGEILLSAAYSMNNINTIEVTSSSIHIGNRSKNNILVFDLDGRHITTHLSAGDNDTFNMPFLCSFDEKDGIVVVDYRNSRILTLSAGCKWRKLDITGLNLPTCVVVLENRLVVMQQNRTIKFFSF